MRASSLDRILGCPASLQEPAMPVVGDDSASRLGTALHRVMVPIVLGQPEEDAEAISSELQVDAGQVRLLASLGRKFWTEYGPNFPDPVCEAALEEDGPLYLTGHVDVLSVDKSATDNQVRVLDWKSGWVESSHIEQMRAYAYLACKTHDADSAWVGIARIREQELIPYEFTWDELCDWYVWAEGRAENYAYNPSAETCRFCPRRIECPARLSHLRGALVVMTGISKLDDAVDLTSLTDEMLRNGVIAARAISKLCEDFVDQARVEVRHRGNVPGLEINAEERQEIIAKDAWDALEQRLGRPALLDAVKLSKTKVLAPIKRADREGFMQSLPVLTKTIEKLEVKPLPLGVTTT